MKIGDKVNVCMSRNDCFSDNIQQYSNIIKECTIKYTPCSEGDTYHFLTRDGIEFVLNPSSRDFVGIEPYVEIDYNNIPF
jgi:hypothetical protein